MGMGRVWDRYGTGMGRVWDGYGTGMGQVWDGTGSSTITIFYIPTLGTHDPK